MRIRPMKRADIPAVAALTSSHDGRSVTSVRRALELQLESDSIRVWVAAHERVVAYARVANRPVRRGWPAGWYFAGLVVAPRWRRKHLGTRLTRVRMRWLRGRTRRAHIVVNARNEASKRLHAKLGFTFVRALRSQFFRGGRGELWVVRFST